MVAPAGIRAVTRLNTVSGSIAKPVPSARIPKPNQTQLTSGFTTTLSVTLWFCKSKAASTR